MAVNFLGLIRMTEEVRVQWTESHRGICRWRRG